MFCEMNYFKIKEKMSTTQPFRFSAAAKINKYTILAFAKYIGRSFIL